MKKFLGICVICILNLCFIIPGLGCSSNNNSGDVEFWGAPAEQKILQDKTDLYEDIKRSAAVSIVAAKGEYESAQIIMTAKSDVAAYDVEVQDLKSSDGKKFSRNNITVYVERYINIEQNYDNIPNQLKGMYPDALVPFVAIKEYGENRITANSNQGLYFTFNVPIGQAADIYTGEIKISCDGKTENIPVTLSVLNLEVNEKTHTKSIFLNSWAMQSGELNMSQALVDSYTDALLEFRLSPNMLVNKTEFSDEDIAYYAEKAYKYCVNDRFSNYSIPYKIVTVDNQNCFDVGVFHKYVMALAQKSMDTGVNLLEKAVCYFGYIDEPDQFGLIEAVKVTEREFGKAVEVAAQAILAADYNTEYATPKFVQAVAESARNIQNVVTVGYNAALDGYVKAWCPMFHLCDSEDQRTKYDEVNVGDKWWYGCNSPDVPYATYHIDDSMLSPRLVSWMQAEYGITGNLYWATNYYTMQNGNFIDDYFDYAERGFRCNGDGMLFYPGGQYGLDKPIPSMRLMSIRDGLEEYELLYNLQRKYDNVGESGGFTKMLQSITKSLYSGTKVIATVDAFAAARKTMIELCLLAESDANVLITDFFDTGYGEMEYTLHVNSGYDLKIDGKPVEVVNNKVKVRKALTAESNQMVVSVNINGETLQTTLSLGGQATLFEANSNGFQSANAQVVAKAESVAGVVSGEQAVQVSVSANDDGKYQTITYTDSNIVGIGANSERLVMHIYSETEESYTLYIAFISPSGRKQEVGSVEINPGVNTLELNGLSSSGKIARIELIFDKSKGQKTPKEIYLLDYVLYNK